MGSEASREERLISSINKLSRNPSQWPSVVEEFKKNVPKGTPLRCRDKRVFEVMLNVLKDEQAKETNVLPLLEAFERLLFAKGLFKAVSGNKGNMLPFLQTVTHDNLHIVYTGLLVLKEMVDPQCPPLKHNTYEITNKNMFEHANGFESLSKLIIKFAYTDKVDIVIAALDILYSFLVVRYDTTSFDAKQKMVHLFLPHHVVFHDLSRHNVPSLRLIACNVLVALIKESDEETYRQLQEDARDHGALLWQFRYAIMLPNSQDNYSDGDKSEQRFVSRELLARLCDGNKASLDLLARIVPARFVDRLRGEEDPENDEERDKKKKQIVRRIVDQDGKIIKMNKTEKAIAEKQVKNIGNWSETSQLWVQLFQDLETDYDRPDVIWNETTRKELRTIIENEISDLDLMRMYKRNIVTWDSEGFDINYPSLRSELKVDRYYLRTLVPELELKKSLFEIPDPAALMRNVYDKCVVEDNEQTKQVYLQTIAGLVDRYDIIVAEEVPMQYLVWLLSPEHVKENWREVIIGMLHILFKYHGKTQEFVAAGGIRALVYHLCFVHTLVIKRKKSTENENENDGRDVYELDTPSLTLDILALLEMLTVYPRICRKLSYPTTLQYIVQVLLGGHPALSSQTTVLLSAIVDSNPKIVPSLHRTGVFTFLVATLGDSVSDAAARFLYAYHMQMLGEGQERQSILKKYFPDSMIKLLTKGGPQKFAQTLVGEAETPELIWNRDMRQTLLDSVNTYLERFKSALKRNPHLTFEYEEPPQVRYVALERELCVNGIYLRVFNKTDNYPLREPNAFLSDATIIMNSNTLDDSNMQLLIQAQTTLFRLIPDLEGFKKYDGFQMLVNILRKEVDTSDLTTQAADLLYCLLTKDQREEEGKRAEEAVGTCLDLEIVEVVCSLIMETMRESLAVSYNLVKLLLKIMASLLQYDRTQDAVYERPHVLRHIVSFFKESVMSQYPEIAISALMCVIEYAKSIPLQTQLVHQGVLLYLTRMAVNGRHEKLVSTVYGSRISELAAEALHYIMKAQRSQDGTMVDSILAQLLTPGLYIQLKNPQTFLRHARGKMATPILIYNDQTRFELEQFLNNEIAAVELSGAWRPDQFSFMYPSLSKEVQVDGVFLRIFNENPSFQLPQQGNFLQSLLASLSEEASMSLQMDSSISGEAVKRAYASQLCKVQALYNLLSEHQGLLDFISAYNDLGSILGLIHSTHVPLKYSVVTLLGLMSKHKQSIPLIFDYFSALHAVMYISTDRFTPPITSILGILEECVRRASQAIPKIIDGGIIISILGLFAFPKKYGNEARTSAARLLGCIGSDKLYGKQACALLKVIFVNEFEKIIERAADHPQDLVDFYDKNHDSPLIIWNDKTRQELCFMVNKEMSAIDRWFARNPRQPFKWDYTTLEDRYQRPSLQGELCIGGIYVANFIKSPFFQIDGDKFIFNTFAALEHELVFFTKHRGSEITKRTYGNMNLMWEALLALLTNNNSYANHPMLTQYMKFIFQNLREGLDHPLVMVILQVLNIVTRNEPNVRFVEKHEYVKDLVALHRIYPECLVALLSLVTDLIRRRPSIGIQFRAAGGVVIILETLLLSKDPHNRAQAVSLLTAMCSEPDFKDSMMDYVTAFLTSRFADVLESSPEKFLSLFDGEHFDEYWERFWNADIRHALQRLLSRELDDITRNLEHHSLNRGDIFSLDKLEYVYREGHHNAVSFPVSKRERHTTAGSTLELGLMDDPDLRRHMSMQGFSSPPFHEIDMNQGRAGSAPRSSPLSMAESHETKPSVYGRSY